MIKFAKFIVNCPAAGPRYGNRSHVMMSVFDSSSAGSQLNQVDVQSVTVDAQFRGEVLSIVRPWGCGLKVVRWVMGDGIGVDVVGSTGQVGVMVFEASSGNSPLIDGKCGEVVGCQLVGGGIAGEGAEGGKPATMVHWVGYGVLEVKAAEKTMEGAGFGWKI